MARVAGINIPDRKQTWISLTHIYGIGRTTALKICASTGINYDTKIESLNEEDTGVKYLHDTLSIIVLYTLYASANCYVCANIQLFFNN